MDFYLKSEAIAFVLLAVGYVVGRKYIAKSERKNRQISDEEYLAMMALEGECSEYALFLSAAGQWRVSPAQVEGDFRMYLMQGVLPHYLRDYVRKKKATDPFDRKDPLNPGGRLPASWSA